MTYLAKLYEAWHVERALHDLGLRSKDSLGSL
ncbi:hypothetical protein GGR59_002375 [Xanthomonas arboricola]|nr:hypothetical protein [Xanthomonas arboricola]